MDFFPIRVCLSGVAGRMLPDRLSIWEWFERPSTVPARNELTDGVAEVRRLRPDTGKHHQQMTGGTTPIEIEEERPTPRSVEQAIPSWFAKTTDRRDSFVTLANV